MPFGYSKEIFKYPPVQYIPLTLYNIRSGKYPLPKDRPRFYIFENQDKLNRKLSALSIIDNYEIKENNLSILIVNGIINLIQYRGYEIIMVGEKNPGNYQLFQITKEYFYKDKLIFLLYDGDTADRIDWKKYIP